MTKERLSRLQKWILEELYIQGARNPLAGKKPVFWRSAVFHRASEDGLFKPSRGRDNPEATYLNVCKKERNSNGVIFSRSLWRLIESGYLEAEGPAKVMPIMMKCFDKFGDVEGKAVTEKIFEDQPFAFMSPGQAVPVKSQRAYVQAKVITLTEKGREMGRALVEKAEALKVKKDKLTISNSEVVDDQGVSPQVLHTGNRKKP